MRWETASKELLLGEYLPYLDGLHFELFRGILGFFGLIVWYCSLCLLDKGRRLIRGGKEGYNYQIRQNSWLATSYSLGRHTLCSQSLTMTSSIVEDCK